MGMWQPRKPRADLGEGTDAWVPGGGWPKGPHSKGEDKTLGWRSRNRGQASMSAETGWFYRVLDPP